MWISLTWYLITCWLCFPRRFPSKLRSMCHCLFHVVNQRFQQSTGEAVWTVIGTVIFLRFINPAIGKASSATVVEQECSESLGVCTTLLFFSFHSFFLVCKLKCCLNWVNVESPYQVRVYSSCVPSLITVIQADLNGTPLRSGRVSCLNRKYLKTYIETYFVVPQYVLYRFGNFVEKWMYLLNRKNRNNAFPRSTNIIQVLNELPTDKRHIKVPQDRLLCPTHINNKKKQVFLLKCVTQPDLSRVPFLQLVIYTISVWHQFAFYNNVYYSNSLAVCKVIAGMKIVIHISPKSLYRRLS